MLIHCADLYSASKEFPIAQEWSTRINKEFTNQTLDEKAQGLPVTSYMLGLENLQTMARQEINFIKAIIKPLWVSVNDFLDKEIPESVQNCEDNIANWEKILLSNSPSDEKH